MEIPSTPWVEAPWQATAALAHAPDGMGWRLLEGSVGHTFTHFHLELSILVGREDGTVTAEMLNPFVWRIFCQRGCSRSHSVTGERSRAFCDDTDPPRP